jgi:hypothetical protein
VSRSTGTDVRINDLVTEVVVTDPVGPLAAEDVQKIVNLVLEHVRADQERRAQQTRDTALADRSYDPHHG